MFRFGLSQMGYAQMNQRGQGIHLRQFSRAFIVDDDKKRVVFVSVDGAMISHPIRRDVSQSGVDNKRVQRAKAMNKLCPNRIGGETTTASIWKYLSIGQCRVKWHAYARNAGRFYDASAVRYDDIWLRTGDVSSAGSWYFQSKSIFVLLSRRKF